MTALMGAAVLGLVPLPSKVNLDACGGRSDQRSTPSENANSAHPICSLGAILEGTAIGDSLARVRRALRDIDAQVTRNELRQPGSNKRLMDG